MRVIEISYASAKKTVREMTDYSDGSFLLITWQVMTT